MSNKKQPQYIVKTVSSDGAGSAPPRYQPPPQPPVASGILKHHHHHQQLHPQQQHPQQLLPAPVKDASKTAYPVAKSGPDLMKAAPFDHGKLYPGAHPPVKAGYLGYAYGDARAQPADDPSARMPAQQRRYAGDEDVIRAPPPPVDMLKFVRKTDGDARHVQGLVNELRALKEANQRLADDNQELRDLCCFLDDDRQKGRKLAREWQRFGRYTASVMRQEVSAYQSKLRDLDSKQQELIKDNLELKELCLYLDEERAGASVCPACGTATTASLRDDGDGSSSSTNADEPPNQFSAAPTSAPVGSATGNATPRRSASRERLLHENLARQRSTFNDQTVQYVRSLEQRVKQLEEEKRALQLKLKGGSDPGVAVSTDPVLSGRPEAVVRALQVLEVREQLERESRTISSVPDRPDAPQDSAPSPDMDDGEKALVREMCNVVWRKLEEGPQPRR